MVENKILGKITCKFCQTGGQVLLESKKQKAYYVCDECDMQVFSRSKRSHNRLVELATAAPPPAPPKPAPAPQPTKETTDGKKPVPGKQPEPAKPRAGLWD